MYKHSCPKWDKCSAGFCPQTGEGSHAPDDDYCGLLPSARRKGLKEGMKGASPEETAERITMIYQRSSTAPQVSLSGM